MVIRFIWLLRRRLQSSCHVRDIRHIHHLRNIWDAKTKQTLIVTRIGLVFQAADGGAKLRDSPGTRWTSRAAFARLEMSSSGTSIPIIVSPWKCTSNRCSGKVLRFLSGPKVGRGSNFQDYGKVGANRKLHMS